MVDQNVLAKLDDLIVAVAKLEARLDDLPERVRALEKFQVKVATIGSIFAFLFTGVLAFLGHKH